MTTSIREESKAAEAEISHHNYDKALEIAQKLFREIDNPQDTIEEKQKKPHTTVFSIYCGDEFIGLGEWSASWDTWSPHSWFIIWSEHRRTGYDTEVAKLLLGKTFMENPRHEATAAIQDWNQPAALFLYSMGFRQIGKMRRVGMIDGQYHDLLFFDLLKSEYLQTGKGVHQ